MIRVWMRSSADKKGRDVECFDALDAMAALEREAPTVAVLETFGHDDFFDAREALRLAAQQKQNAAKLTNAVRPSFECYAEEGIAATASGWRIILRRMRFDGTPRGS